MDEDIDFLLNPSSRPCAVAVETPPRTHLGDLRQNMTPNSKPLAQVAPQTPQLPPQPNVNPFTQPGVSDFFSRLHPHQRAGVQWLLEQHWDGPGCLLADEMGLGKTVQTAFFLGALMRARWITTVLIVVPTTLLDIWHRCLTVEWPMFGPHVVEIVNSDKRQALRESRWQRLSHGVPLIIITTYGIMKRDLHLIKRHRVDYCVLDEAHCIKEAASGVAKAALDIQAHHRLAITGTPVMNRFQDLWTLFEFIDPALLGGNAADFRTGTDQAIFRANEKDSSKLERELGLQRLRELQSRLFPKILRRDKSDVLPSTAAAQVDDSTSCVVIGNKIDVVVWVALSDVQRRQYLELLESDELTAALSGAPPSRCADRETKKGAFRHTPLTLLNALKNITQHPWLNLSEKNFRLARITPHHPLEHFPEFGTILSSAKLQVALELIQSHWNVDVDKNQSVPLKTVVFSRSRRLLDMLAFVLTSNGIRFLQLDGSVPVQQRSKVLEAFSEENLDLLTGVAVLLSTTQVGGVGLTITAASRVIVLDSSWNPACDAQAVDRVHRLGQSRDVVVYRLLSPGTVDELLYRNQIAKSLAALQMNPNRAAHNTKWRRFFTKTELRSMFKVGDLLHSSTAHQIRSLSKVSVAPDGLLAAAISECQSFDGVVDVSDHSIVGGLATCGDEHGDDSQDEDTQDSTTSLIDVWQTPKERRRKYAEAQLTPLKSLAELAEEIDPVEIPPRTTHRRTVRFEDSVGEGAYDQDEETPAPYDPSLEDELCFSSRPTRCSIFLQDEPLEAICAGTAAVDWDGNPSSASVEETEVEELSFFLFRGIPIRRLRLQAIYDTTDADSGLGLRPSTAVGEQFAFSANVDLVLSSPIEGFDWDVLNGEDTAGRPSWEERRRQSRSFPSLQI